jgi:transcriptional regulator with XRE-family HTH domain
LNILEIKKTIGKTIKKLRIDKEISQEELAHRSHIHVSQLSRMENGKANPSLEILITIAQELKIHIRELFNF